MIALARSPTHLAAEPGQELLICHGCILVSLSLENRSPPYRECVTTDSPQPDAAHPRGVTLTWLGQAGFLLRSDSATVLVDGFLSPHPRRVVPPPVDPATLTGVDAILCTHEHRDHFDANTVLAVSKASPDAVIVVPEPIVDQVYELGIDKARVIGARDGQRVPGLPFAIDPIPSEHGVNVSDAYDFGRSTPDSPARYLGYVIELGGARVYHSGDTTWWTGQEDAIRALGAHVALLPINGRDPVREEGNLVGNLDHREAALLADRAGVDLLVPMHWDMMVNNPGFPDHLVRVVHHLNLDLNLLVPRRMRPFHYTPGL